MAFSVDPQVSAIIRTVLERCQKESENNSLQVPLDNVEARTTYYTGYSPALVYQISETINDKSLTHTFDVLERLTINKVLYVYYKDKKTPKLSNIYEIVKPSLKMLSYYDFKNEMNNLGFFCIPTTSEYLVIEDPKLRFERSSYLSKIIKMRSDGTDVVYVDVNEIYTSGKNEFSDDQAGIKILKSGVILMHAVSVKGLVSYLFSNKMCHDIFNKWLYDVVLPILKPGTLVVMNDHCLLGALLDEVITRYHTKTDMINWLKCNNISCSEKMNKAELYDLIEKCPKKGKGYAIDKLIKAYGFEVLHIPFKCKNFSLTHQLWKLMDGVDLQKKLPSQELIITKIENVIKSSFPQLDQDIKNWEIEMYSNDLKIEEELDKNYSFDIKKIMNPLSDL